VPDRCWLVADDGGVVEGVVDGGCGPIPLPPQAALSARLAAASEIDAAKTRDRPDGMRVSSR
jgi:hypothetical protein